MLYEVITETVYGMLLPMHKNALENIKKMFVDSGYNLSFTLLNASDYEVPQDRKRVFFVGYRKDLNKTFKFPSGKTIFYKKTLRQVV